MNTHRRASRNKKASAEARAHSAALYRQFRSLCDRTKHLLNTSVADDDWDSERASKILAECLHAQAGGIVAGPIPGSDAAETAAMRAELIALKPTFGIQLHAHMWVWVRVPGVQRQSLRLSSCQSGCFINKAYFSDIKSSGPIEAKTIVINNKRK